MKYRSAYLKNLCIKTIPLTFLLAGAGMLILLRVNYADGDFYSRLQSESEAWTLSHIVLLLGSMTIIPAAIGIKSLIVNQRQELIASLIIPVVGISAFLLAGQYAIDFLMPEISRIGGDAKSIHHYLSDNDLVNVLFYKLPNLASLGLLILSLILIWDGRLTKILAWILGLNWMIVILGNLVSPEVQRLALFLLGVTFIFIIRSLRD